MNMTIKIISICYCTNSILDSDSTLNITMTIEYKRATLTETVLYSNLTWNDCKRTRLCFELSLFW